MCTSGRCHIVFLMFRVHTSNRAFRAYMYMWKVCFLLGRFRGVKNVIGLFQKARITNRVSAIKVDRHLAYALGCLTGSAYPVLVRTGAKLRRGSQPQTPSRLTVRSVAVSSVAIERSLWLILFLLILICFYYYIVRLQRQRTAASRKF